MAIYREGGFVQLPPDSTGKKSSAAGRLILQCDNYNPSVRAFEVGQTITGETSGATAQIVGFHTEALPAGDIEIYCDLDSLVNDFQVNENIQITGLNYAKTKVTASLDKIYYQKNSINDRDYLDRSWRIGERGDGYVRFDEGSPTISVFGGLVTENPETSRQYIFAYDERPKEFYDNVSGGATISYVSTERSVLLDTNGTVSGVLAQRTSHLYHPYQPGTMSKVVQTVVVGDAGKTGVRRRWGYFDDNNGLFWELDGTTLYVVIRSDTTGSPVDTRVQQIDWNQDQLDGTILFNLDVTKANLYWIDFQWLGVGLVKFGVFEENGTKTTCHIFKNPNSNNSPYMRMGSLPIRYECENTGTAASSSELKAICAVVQNVGQIKRQLDSFSVVRTSGYDTGGVGAGVEVPFLSLRAKSTLNGLDNHSLIFPSEIHIASEGTGPFAVRVRSNCITNGSSFTSVNNSSATEYTASPSGFLASGDIPHTEIIMAGESFDNNFLDYPDRYQQNIVTSVLSDGVTQPEIVITIQPLGASSSGVFYGSLNIDEIQY